MLQGLVLISFEKKTSEGNTDAEAKVFQTFDSRESRMNYKVQCQYEDVFPLRSTLIDKR